jgi:insulysin
MATFNYISMLRSTDLSPTHQTEVSALSNIRFRFSEKRRPDDYAVWMADKLSWPVPRELVIKAPQVVSEWDHDGTAQAVAFQTLKGLSVKNSRHSSHGKAREFSELLGNSAVGDGAMVRDPISSRAPRRGLHARSNHFPLRGQGL